jgi:hypothetical protein
VKTDILVVNKGIQLFRGGRFVAEVSTAGAYPYVRALHNSVGCRFTLELFDGTRLRAELNLTLLPLTERVFTAVQAALGEELALLIRLDCVRLKLELANLIIDDSSWVALQMIVMELLGAHSESSRENEELSWMMLQRSGYHSRHHRGRYPLLRL